MVLDLEKPLAVQKSGSKQALDILFSFVQFAGVFFPVEGIIANIAETIVKDSLQAAKAGSVFFQISEDSLQKLAKVTRKELTKNYELITEAYDSGKDLLTKLAKVQDEANDNPDAHVSDVLDYQANADQYSRNARSFLQNTWNDILNNGFSDGGIISQIFSGDVLDLNVPAAGAARLDDHGSQKYDNAVLQYFNYLMQRSSKYLKFLPEGKETWPILTLL